MNIRLTVPVTCARSDHICSYFEFAIRRDKAESEFVRTGTAKGHETKFDNIITLVEDAASITCLRTRSRSNLKNEK